MKVYDREKSNKFPKCFSMEIDAEPLNSANGFNNGNKRKYQLFLSFCFSDQHEEFLEEHTIQIGIKGGELNLKLTKILNFAIYQFNPIIKFFTSSSCLINIYELTFCL